MLCSPWRITEGGLEDYQHSGDEGGGLITNTQDELR